MMLMRLPEPSTRNASRVVTDPAELRCRFCSSLLRHTFVDLGASPLCQKHVTPRNFHRAEAIYPLHAYVCHACFLVQLPSTVPAEEIFDDEYAYFSSFSDTMLTHARRYVAEITHRLHLGPHSRVVEIASNDGYLLQYFVQAGIPCLGIEPTANTAAAAAEKGVPTLVKFFGRATAREVVESHGPADLVLGNNVLAHVPDINDFVGGIKLLLAPRGVVTMEFPQLLQLISRNYWDTIYHEHYSYLSFTTVEKIFAAHGMELFDVEEIDIHGGSLRIYARHAGDESHPVSPRVDAMKEKEALAGQQDIATYTGFGRKVQEHKRQILSWLIEQKRAGKQIAAYGAPGKGNTLLNYCGIRTDFIDYTVDRSPHKQGNFLPGTRIPILAPEKVDQTRPDFLLILVWNLKEEVMQQMKHIRSWGGKFVVFMPQVEVFD
ncbi:MAG: class I SAM-dependent methyltransferase [Phycisphaerae bacterium]|nr:class I SAM-dependent methyltransferase [Phycisphaerae bacterium]